MQNKRRVSKKTKSFVTSFGDQITLNDDYLEQFGGRLSLPSKKDIVYNDTDFKCDLGTFVLKNYECATIMDRIRRQGIRPKFSKLLDIGSGTAVMPKICYAKKYAEHVTCVDFYPWGKSAINNKKVVFFLNMIWGCQFLNLKNLRGPMLHWEWLVSKENFAPCFPRSEEKFEYVVGDFFQQTGEYDWINSSLTLNYFDPEKIFQKVASLLSSSGLFTFNVSCWWFPRNQTKLVGKMPYASQRLNEQDFKRYIKQVHPEIPVSDIMDAYKEFSPKAPASIEDYISSAAKYGLYPVFIDGHMPNGPTNKRCGVTPGHMKIEHNEAPIEVIKNIKKFRSDVTLQELYTSHYLMGFKKV
jgi:SAM-dependent methyltransferase